MLRTFTTKIYDEKVDPSGKVPDIRTDGIYPYLPNGGVVFDVLIPKGVQRELKASSRTQKRL